GPAVDVDLEVEVVAGGEARAPDAAQDRGLGDLVALLDVDAGQVAVDGLPAAAVVDDDRVAQPVLPAGEGHVAVVDGVDRGPLGGGDVDPVVVAAAPAAVAEAGGHLAGNVERPAEDAGADALDFLAALDHHLDGGLADELIAEDLDADDLAVEPLHPLHHGAAALPARLLDVLLPRVHAGIVLDPGGEGDGPLVRPHFHAAQRNVGVGHDQVQLVARLEALGVGDLGVGLLQVLDAHAVVAGDDPQGLAGLDRVGHDPVGAAHQDGHGLVDVLDVGGVGVDGLVADVLEDLDGLDLHRLVDAGAVGGAEFTGLQLFPIQFLDPFHGGPGVGLAAQGHHRLAVHHDGEGGRRQAHGLCQLVFQDGAVRQPRALVGGHLQGTALDAAGHADRHAARQG